MAIVANVEHEFASKFICVNVNSYRISFCLFKMAHNMSFYIEGMVGHFGRKSLQFLISMSSLTELNSAPKQVILRWLNTDDSVCDITTGCKALTHSTCPQY